ncbi:hypothetical protein CN957_23760 [Bacillus cereus]|nr:hypothetical protein CN957_23760 [Bacillus cereus]
MVHLYAFIIVIAYEKTSINFDMQNYIFASVLLNKRSMKLMNMQVFLFVYSFHEKGSQTFERLL